MKCSELLRAAKPFLWDGVGVRRKGLGPKRQSAFICNALTAAVGQIVGAEAYQKGYTAYVEIRKSIYGAIKPSVTMEEFLRDRSAKELSPAEVQSYRLTWIDNMIAYYEGLETLQERSLKASSSVASTTGAINPSTSST